MDVCKAFDTVDWWNVYKLFSELGVKGKMFAIIRALYTDVGSLYILMVYRLRLFLYTKGLDRDAFWHFLCIRCTLTDFLRQFVTANTF